MDTIALGDQEQGWASDPGEPGVGLALTRRPKRRFLNRYTAALAALLTAAAGFYAGVRVEKSQTSSSTAGLSALASRFSALGGASAGARSAGARAPSGFAARFGGAGATVGTVASVNGRTLYVTEASGDEVKVQLSSASVITKSESVSASAVHPGDTVLIQGVKQPGGSIVATSVTDSGSGGGLSGLFGGRAGSGSSSPGSAGGGLSSLFSSGG
jgi:hypothetical protein